MRYTVLPLLFCLSLWVTAQPFSVAAGGPVLSLESSPRVAPGQMITVQVTGAPAETMYASFDLSPRVHGLALRQIEPGVWQGSFAVMSSMAGETFQPQAQLYDAQRKSIAVQPGVKGLSVSVSPPRSESGQQGAIVTTPDGRIAVAFDETIRMDTLEVNSRTELAPFRPDVRNNYLVLPQSLKAENIISVSALNLQGLPVVLTGPAASKLVIGAR